MVSVPSLHPGLLAAVHPWDPSDYKRKLARVQGEHRVCTQGGACVGAGRVAPQWLEAPAHAHACAQRLPCKQRSASALVPPRAACELTAV